MMEQIVRYVAALPSVSRLKGGVSTDYSDGKNTGMSIKADPGIAVISRYLNGNALVRRDFKAEVYFNFNGPAEVLFENHNVLEDIQSELNNGTYPVVPEGEIVEITVSDGGTAVKSAVGDGVVSFKFAVFYKTELRRAENAGYSV